MNNIKNKIFIDSLINSKIADFNIKQLSNFSQIKEIISSWNENVKSKRVILENETGIKGQYINEIFGTILGFNFTNANTTHLRHELKTQLDGTKPDAVLGYFYSSSNSEEIDNDVRAVVEMKDASTDLDKIQNRPNQKISPIDQAFQYSYKMYDGKCRWVIVSNFLEIRFYKSNFQGEYELFLLEDLLKDEVLKRFIFLFHIDRFLDRETSSTERLYEKNKKYKSEDVKKTFHVVDEMFEALKRFDGMTFIPPEIISNLKPFNILEDYVWYYNRFSLFTINKDIYEFLNNITIENENINISSYYERILLEKDVVDYSSKIKYIFEKLNHCFIYKINAVKNYEEIKIKNEKRNVIGFSLRHAFHYSETEGKEFDILINKKQQCDCYQCNFNDFQFSKLLTKIKSGLGNPDNANLEFAYVNYLLGTNNYKETYLLYRQILKNIKGKERKEIEYFIAKYNLKYLHNLMHYYSFNDKEEILNELKDIDLDKVISEDLETTIDSKVRSLLLDIKEHESIYRKEKELDDYLIKLENLNSFYRDESGERIGSNYINELHEILCYVHFYYNVNFLIGTSFSNYEKFALKIFRGLILSYSSTNYEHRLKEFSSLYLTHAIIYISTDEIEKILKKNRVNNIDVKDSEKNKLIDKTKNLLESRYDSNTWGINSNKLMDEFLNLYPFSDRYTRIFSNSFLILKKVNLSQSDIDTLFPKILNFLKIENELAWFDLKHLGDFIYNKGELIKPELQFEILKIITERFKPDNNKYIELFNKICLSLRKHYHSYKIDSQHFLQRVHTNCFRLNDKLDHQNLIFLYHILDKKSQDIILNIFKGSLNKELDFDLYDKLIRNEILDYNYEDYFERYIEDINRKKPNGNYKIVNNDIVFQDFTFLNFILLIHVLNIDIFDTRLKKFTRLSEIEKWLLNPFEFNYELFLPEWIFALDNDYFLKNINNIKEIEVALAKSLKENHNNKLSEIYFKYFS